AGARLGCTTLLVTLTPDGLGQLSCNPAVGGVGKGQLVKEIDALGGWMGELADSACLQYRCLNTTRGAAVQSTRMQVDLDVYPAKAAQHLRALDRLTVATDEAREILVRAGRVAGVRLAQGGDVTARAVVITPGTFFGGLIHIGDEHFSGGRLGETAAESLPRQLRSLGLVLGRFKTGTTPRLDGASIDFSKLTEQTGDAAYVPFSVRSPRQPVLPQRSCFVGHTTLETHRIIRENLGRSALYSGQIKATGVRYCPSVEDKIVKFSERESHHIFVEPEGLHTTRFYPNGLSNSLPLDVQADMVHSVPGLENARIVQAGYGIEHDYLDPTQLKPTLETKMLGGLFFAGQINGTTGYEEAAAQGLLAGINAACGVLGRNEVVLDRSQAYLGVLVDDLVTKGTNEPYRMFTSRVEYRLVIREDNADERLTPLGHELGLISDADFTEFKLRLEARADEHRRLEARRLTGTAEVNRQLQAWGLSPVNGSVTLLEMLRRPEVDYARLAQLDPETQTVPDDVRRRVDVDVKYAGYIKRQMTEVARFKDLEAVRIPPEFVYAGVPGLTKEISEKLTRLRPLSLGQASRVSGVTPAAVTLLYMLLSRKGPARHD
ncbi:MAG: tRNA uridine-5-carboxymethylaminomethyl(34) synthesis enzyme MnmG, partial [Candidatus Firestonebacteria bacterium]|nr:tRNA uridine-5-carboxymethylaminomethyl(34) synthesis enzyme MnmG [Candidatus Firestonebacteria bacterium]